MSALDANLDHAGELVGRLEVESSHLVADAQAVRSSTLELVRELARFRVTLSPEPGFPTA